MQTIDSLKLAKKVSKKASELGKNLDIMLQLKPQFYYSLEDAKLVLKGQKGNMSDTVEYSLTKSGLPLESIPEVLNFISSEQNSLRLTGLMIIGEPGDVRIFETMANVKRAVEELFELGPLGNLIRTVNGNECRLP